MSQNLDENLGLLKVAFKFKSAYNPPQEKIGNNKKECKVENRPYCRSREVSWLAEMALQRTDGQQVIPEMYFPVLVPLL